MFASDDDDDGMFFSPLDCDKNVSALYSYIGGRFRCAIRASICAYAQVWLKN